MKILSAAQIKALDAATILAQGITSGQLMERAATACTDWLTATFSRDTPFVIFCGSGNNGGDGLCIARQLLGNGYAVKAFLVAEEDRLTPDTRRALKRLQSDNSSNIEIVSPSGLQIEALPGGIVVVDALRGTGLQGPLTGDFDRIVRQLSGLSNTIVAIDMPSGLPPDGNMDGDSAVVQAHYTLVLGGYKRSLLHPETGVYAGKEVLLDIGLEDTLPDNSGGHFFTFSKAEVAPMYRPRQPFSHKGSHGTAFIIGGEHGMIGAAALAVKAASRAGAGKVRGLVPGCGYTILQTLAPEAMCKISGTEYLEDFDGWQDATAVAVGPGMGTEEPTAKALEAMLRECRKPMVLDAGALGILGKNKSWLHGLPPFTILTPHPKEFERMFGETPDSFARVDLARSEAMRYKIIIVVKDRYTAVCMPDGAVHYNLSGNAALATGGSGDVLCGVITGLLSSGYRPGVAALLGVYLHGTAGEIASRKWGMESVIAGDIVAALGRAFKTLA
jgi:NAD(P)H-hydrate epimerase